MNSLFLTTLLFLLILSLPVQAREVKTGDSIQDVSGAMLEAKYKPTMLAMQPPQGCGFKMWPVDSGVLIFIYSLNSQKVTEITYFLADDRPKALRNMFTFPVVSFDTVSGILSLKTRENRPVQ